MRFSGWLKRTLIVLIVLGIVFRFVNLNHKVYGQNEAYATLQAAGYIPQEVERSLFQNQLLQARDLQQYQQIKPGSTPFDTIKSLAIASPQQPPLYFLASRAWMQTFEPSLSRLFKSSLTTQRSLPAVISLLALPAMYGLAWELFASHNVALLATTLVALSPFDVLMAQTAQSYSLMTVMVIVSSFLLLKAIHRSATSDSVASHSLNKQLFSFSKNWGWYSLSIAIGLYTQPLFALTAISHIGYVLACSVIIPSWKFFRQRVLTQFGVSLAIAIAAFSPWIVVMASNLLKLNSSTRELQTNWGLNGFLKQWVQSLITPFFDWGFELPFLWNFLVKASFLLLIVVSLYQVFLRTPKPVGLLVVFLVGVPFLVLVRPDTLWNGMQSTVTHYLLLCIPGIQLAVAYFFANRCLFKESNQFSAISIDNNSNSIQPRTDKHKRVWFWKSVFCLIAISCLTSLIISASSNSWWDKDSSYFNDRTAEIINVIPDAIIVSDIGDGYANMGDLLSLSYRLQPDTKLLLLGTPDAVDIEKFSTLIQGKNAIVFRPSKSLQQILEQTYGDLSPMLVGERLLKISSDSVRK